MKEGSFSQFDLEQPHIDDNSVRNVESSKHNLLSHRCKDLSEMLAALKSHDHIQAIRQKKRNLLSSVEQTVWTDFMQAESCLQTASSALSTSGNLMTIQRNLDTAAGRLQNIDGVIKFLGATDVESGGDTVPETVTAAPAPTLLATLSAPGEILVEGAEPEPVIEEQRPLPPEPELNKKDIHDRGVAVLIKTGLSKDEAEKRVSRSIDVAFDELGSDQIALREQLDRIIRNFEYQYNIAQPVNPAPQLKPEKRIEPRIPIESPQVQVAETVGVAELENPTTAILDAINSVLKDWVRTGRNPEGQVDRAELITLRSQLLVLHRRYQNYSSSIHRESDKTVRDLIAAQTLHRINRISSKAREHIENLNQHLNSSVGKDRYRAELPSESSNDIARENAASVTPPSPMNQPIDVIPNILPLESTSEQQNNLALAAEYKTLLHDVRVLRRMPARIIAGSKEFPLILASRENALDVLKEQYDALLARDQNALSAELQLEVRNAEILLDPPSLRERIAAMKPSVKAIAGRFEELRIQKKVVPVDPTGVVLLDPVKVTETAEPFSRRPEVIDASASSADTLLREVKGTETETVTTPLVNRAQEAATEQQLEKRGSHTPRTIELAHTPEVLKEYIQNYTGGSEAFSDDLQSWVDGIQGIHHSRWKLLGLFGAQESNRDGYTALKSLTISQFRGIIALPENARQSTLSELNITPEDFEKWRREFTLSSMVEDLRELMRNGSTTFEEWARYTFAVTHSAEARLERSGLKN